MGDLFADGTKKLQLSRSQFDELQGSLQEFYQRTKCGAVILADESGLTVSHAGSMDPANFTLLSALASADYAATREMARIVGEAPTFKQHYHEGAKNSVYITAVNDTNFLVVVFDNKTTFGMVRVLAGKTAESLVDVLAHAPVTEEAQEDAAAVEETMGHKDFVEELSSRLSSVLKF